MPLEEGQLSLFANKEDVEKAFQDGEIVLQSWAWIGSYQQIFPFWQVLSSQIHNGKRSYYCHAIPYGSHPCEVHWFDKEDLIPTRLKWRIPTDDEVNQWCKNWSKDGWSEYVKQLNTYHRTDDGDWAYGCYPPYKEEQELVDILKSTGIDYMSFTRDNFEEKMKKILVKK
jgi:hypothetical protein